MDELGIKVGQEDAQALTHSGEGEVVPNKDLNVPPDDVTPPFVPVLAG